MPSVVRRGKINPIQVTATRPHDERTESGELAILSKSGMSSSRHNVSQPPVPISPNQPLTPGGKEESSFMVESKKKKTSDDWVRQPKI